MADLGSPIFSPRGEPDGKRALPLDAVEEAAASKKQRAAASSVGTDGRRHAAAESPEFALELSAEQKAVARRARRGENLFITGPAGTGKSFLLRHIIAELQSYYNPDRRGLPTGGGTGVGDEPPANMRRLIAAQAWPASVPVFYSQFQRDEHARKQAHRCMVAYGTPSGSLCFLSFETSDAFLALYCAVLRHAHCAAQGAVAADDVCFHEQLYLPCRQFYCCSKATAAQQLDELEQAIRAAAAPSDLGPATVTVTAGGDAQLVFAAAEPVAAPSAARPSYAAALSTYPPVVTAKAVHEAQPHLAELLSAKYSARQTLRLVGSCVAGKPDTLLLPRAVAGEGTTTFASWAQTLSAGDLAPYVTTADDGTTRATWSNPPMSSKAKTESDLTGRKTAGQGGTVAVTAPTGIAAVNVGGVTIHSFAGIGLGNGGTEEIIARVKRSKKACENWANAAALVIDEVSMLSGALFELLDALAKAIRCKPSLPFGGLQLILCGDFCQLPPVASKSNGGGGGGGFCFQSRAWATAGLEQGTIVLQEAHRQASDPTFARLLNEVRRGCCSEEAMAALRECVVSGKPQPTDGILATRLYCTNRDVDAENNNRLAALKGGGCVFTAEDTFDDGIGDWQREKLRDIMDKKVVGRLMLKIGAQVVLVRNLSKSLANGSRGVVVGMQAMLRVRVKFDNGEEMNLEPATFSQKSGGAGSMSRKQLPLKLGWALTVHRAQGMTLTRAELNMDGAFECGQSYVALSRVTSLAGLWMRSELRPEQVTANREVLAYYDARAASSTANAAAVPGSAGATTTAGATGADGVGGGGGGGGAGVEHVVTIAEKGPLGIILTQKAGRVLVSSINPGGRAAKSAGGAELAKGMVLVKAGEVLVKPPAMLWQSKLARLARPLVLTFALP